MSLEVLVATEGSLAVRTYPGFLSARWWDWRIVHRSNFIHVQYQPKSQMAQRGQWCRSGRGRKRLLLIPDCSAAMMINTLTALCHFLAHIMWFPILFFERWPLKRTIVCYEDRLFQYLECPANIFISTTWVYLIPYTHFTKYRLDGDRLSHEDVFRLLYPDKTQSIAHLIFIAGKLYGNTSHVSK